MKIDFGAIIIDSSLPVPAEKRPWFYTTEGRKYWKDRFISGIKSTYGYGLMSGPI